MKRLNFRLLEVFRAVFEAKSVTGASAALNVTQPAVSKAISQLEVELKVKLFHRVRGRLHATADGQWVYSEYLRLFAQVKTFQQSVSDLDRGRTGMVKVAAVPTLAAPLIAQAAASFVSQRPQVNVDVIIAQSDDVIRETALHRVDIGLLHSLIRDRNICSELIGETEIIAVMNEDHTLCELPILTPHDLDDVPIIVLDSGSPPSHLVREAFDEARSRMNIVMRANSTAVATSAAAAGLGIALTDPWPMLAGPPKRSVLRRFLPRIPLRMAMIHSAFRPPSSLAVGLCEEIRGLVDKFANSGELVRTATQQDRMPQPESNAPFAVNRQSGHRRRALGRRRQT